MLHRRNNDAAVPCERQEGFPGNWQGTNSQRIVNGQRSELEEKREVIAGPFRTRPRPGGDATKTLSRFVVNFSRPIVAVLSCFDRVIFQPYLSITNGTASKASSSTCSRSDRCDFMAFAEKQSEALVDHAKCLADEAGAE